VEQSVNLALPEFYSEVYSDRLSARAAGALAERLRREALLTTSKCKVRMLCRRANRFERSGRF